MKRLTVYNKLVSGNIKTKQDAIKLVSKTPRTPNKKKETEIERKFKKKYGKI